MSTVPFEDSPTPELEKVPVNRETDEKALVDAEASIHPLFREFLNEAGYLALNPEDKAATELR